MRSLFWIVPAILSVSSSAYSKDIKDLISECLVECPPGGIQEQEECGQNVNGGCDMEPGTEFFEPIECGTTICGTAWADGGNRDTDWYFLSLSEEVLLRITGQAEFPFQLAIISPGLPFPCQNYGVVAMASGWESEMLELYVPIGPADLWIRANDVRPFGNPCGGDDDDYYITVDCQPCQDTITVEIMTDNFPYETTWELLDIDSGLRWAWGHCEYPFSLYTWNICVDPDRCYVWTIYDAYGDGICCDEGEGYYNVYDADGNLVCTGGDFGTEESCVIGDCAGACCTDGVCEMIDPVTCLGQEGIFYVGEDCADVMCPIYCVEQPPNQSNGILSDLDCEGGEIQILAENFNFDYEKTIESITFWGGYYPGDIPSDPDDISVIFREDNAGVPGAEIVSFMDVEADYKAQTGIILFGVHEYIYRIDFDPPVTLGPGTFHVELYFNTISNPDSWFWETGDLDADAGIAGQSYTLTIPEEPWTYEPTTDMAFSIGCNPAFNYVPGDCNCNSVPLELDDVITMIGTYRGTMESPWHIPCPPHGDNFPPTADPNGNCVANELSDVVTEIMAYRGLGDVSGCPDCPPL